MAQIQNISQAQINDICSNAVRDAAKFGLEFNFREEDIPVLEAFLNRINEELKKSDAPPTSANNIAVIYGTYLGETMMRNYAAEYGFKWGAENHEPMLYNSESNSKLYPVTKVFKRITRDMTENVKSFYDVGKDFVSGKFAENKGDSSKSE